MCVFPSLFSFAGCFAVEHNSVSQIILKVFLLLLRHIVCLLVSPFSLSIIHIDLISCVVIFQYASLLFAASGFVAAAATTSARRRSVVARFQILLLRVYSRRRSRLCGRATRRRRRHTYGLVLIFNAIWILVHAIVVVVVLVLHLICRCRAAPVAGRPTRTRLCVRRRGRGRSDARR